ncbi:MAG: PPC domain-containing protein [Verrucomicrobia bacterium]|nr:PPC domain-containing protein [Verrucomicrobiota bacterium]
MRLLCGFILGLLAGALPLAAQPREPNIGYVYPAGGRLGATFEVVVGGQYLNGVTGAHFSGDGLRAEVLEYNRPLPQNRFNELREEWQELQRKRMAARQQPNPTNTWTGADEKRMAEIRDTILKNPPNRQGNPAIAERVTVKVTVAPEAAPGARELRLATPMGLSNPLVFRVGEWPEFFKPPAQSVGPEIERLRRQFGGPAVAAGAQSPLRVTLPAVLNGQIMPGAVDRFRFTARAGQELVAVASARSLIPYLADAVPGWFQATLALYDAKGNELAYVDDFRFRPDPVLHCVIPHDGDYVLEVKDAIYRGREDFVYRIEVGELPYVTGVFPLGAPAGATTTVELAGWNLPTNQVAWSHSEPGLHPLSVPGGKQVSQPLPFHTGTLPECREQEPNDTPRHAQGIAPPVLVNGRIEKAGDEDVFQISGRAGEAVVAEVWARRLESPLDSVLTLTDAAGRQLAFNDDCEDKGCGLNTHHADSYVRLTLPKDGAYFIRVADRQGKGGAEYAYRLRVSAPQPDFELRVVPSAINARPGASVPVTVYALRKDGFTNEVKLALQNAPPGFLLRGGLSTGEDQAKLTLLVPASARPGLMDLSVAGRATIAGREVVRTAVPADDRMQAFFYRHLVPAQELKLAVSERGPRRVR